jgi:cytochrome c oxidase cbb3-type subunit 4
MSLDLIGLVRGALTAVLFGAFIALWIWSWSSKRKAAFDIAARSPLDDGDDASTAPPQR